MDHTIALIQKTHQGDEQAKAQLVEENVGLVWCVVRSHPSDHHQGCRKKEKV